MKKKNTQTESLELSVVFAFDMGNILVIFLFLSSFEMFGKLTFYKY